MGRLGACARALTLRFQTKFVRRTLADDDDENVLHVMTASLRHHDR